MKSITALLLITVLLPGIGAVSARAEKEKSAEGIDYLVLVNKTHAIPSDWDERIHLVPVNDRNGQRFLPRHH